ncbi:MAG: Na+/H+ antiporter NhaC family protein, partial [Myxococcota bacterium]
LAAAAAVLDGAVLGDHASPISDTTILSSAGSNVDVVTHVRTQLPYVVLVGVVAVALGTLPASFGVSPWLLVPLAWAASGAVLVVIGRKT